MNKVELTKLVKDKLKTNELLEVLKYMEKYLGEDKRSLGNDLIMQTARYNQANNEFNSGLISTKDKDITFARVRSAILQIVDRFPAHGNDPIEPVSRSIERPRSLQEVVGEVLVEHADLEGNRNEVSNETFSYEKKQTKQTILMLTANPMDTSRLNLGVEMRQIKDGMNAATHRKKFEIVREEAVRVSTITKAMMVNRPQIVHFSGHGEVEGLMVMNQQDEHVLFPKSALNRLFKLFADDVKCVFFNACYSAEQAVAISENDIYVVGMNQAMGDDAAVDFAIGFYQSIGEGNDYRFSFEIAMIHMSTNIGFENVPELWYQGKKIEF